MTPFAALGLLAVVVSVALSCGAGDGSSAAAILSRSSEVMATRSFSHTVSECPLCPPPIVTEYAPPNRIKLSHSKGHDDWPYYLIVGDQWLFSMKGTRWLAGDDYKFPFMLLSDPRVLLRIGREPEAETDDMIDGQRYHVVRSRLDSDRFLAQVLPASVLPTGAQREEALRFFSQYVEGSVVRFWIAEGTMLVLQIEVDYPPLKGGDEEGNEPQDPPPFVTRFDYGTPVDVPEEPESMPHGEGERLRFDAQAGAGVIRRAAERYKDSRGVYPPRLEIGTLSEFLDPHETVLNQRTRQPIRMTSEGWPLNPFSDQPMEQVASDSPGDFYYEVTEGGQNYRLCLYGWDGTVEQTAEFRCP